MAARGSWHQPDNNTMPYVIGVTTTVARHPKNKGYKPSKRGWFSGKIQIQIETERRMRIMHSYLKMVWIGFKACLTLHLPVFHIYHNSPSNGCRQRKYFTLHRWYLAVQFTRLYKIQTSSLTWGTPTFQDIGSDNSLMISPLTYDHTECISAI